MKKYGKIRAVAVLLALATVLTACGGTNMGEDGSSISSDAPEVTTITSDTLYVKKVENLPEDFILGMDASCVPALEAGGVKYYDHNGVQKNVYEILTRTASTTSVSGCGTIPMTPTETATAAVTAILTMPSPSASGPPKTA